VAITQPPNYACEYKRHFKLCHMLLCSRALARS
jgi:hypothetical protein